MELKWRTMGDVSPKEKSRVYFCCHEADFDLYFEETVRDILQLQDCAIWYRDEIPSETDEDYLAALGQMQLFVLPVTTRLLTTDNAAMDIDLPIAQREHIPILPLMQERGLENLFNAKCGTLQFLDKHGQDATALKYEDKLAVFLKGVLVGDEQLRRIRAAFDAYIFLSYRKKDRRYAQELMRLIHKNEFARDIAIWYDEFLTPGEDFNDAIGQALEKSVLYALTVTPNLLERGNYIMEHEYPAAVQSGKPILPVEMLETDRASLEQVYHGIPNGIAAADHKQMAGALTQALRTTALRQNDEDPEHNFFIGLAYLSGIDVERDTQRATALITSAAETGLPEAMDKLSQMYENGDGVGRDPYKGVYWQERLTEHWCKLWEETGDWKDGDSYAFELRVLAIYYQELRMETEAVAAAKTLYALAKDQSWGWDHRYYASVILGDFAKENRRLDEAREWYELGLQSAMEQGDRAYKGQVMTLNRLSILADMASDGARARDYAQQMLEIAQKRCETEDEREHVVVALLNISDGWRREREYEQATDYAIRALETARRMHREQSGGGASDLLSLALSACAACSQKSGNREKALDFIAESVSLLEKNVEKTNDFSDRIHLVRSNITCSQILMECKRAEQAKEHADKALEQAKENVAISSVEETRRDLAKAYVLQMQLAVDSDEHGRVLELGKQAMALLPEYENTADDRSIAMSCLNNMVIALEAEGSYEEVLECRKQMLKRAEEEIQISSDWDSVEQLFVCQNNLATCFRKLERLRESRLHYDAALAIGASMPKAIPGEMWDMLATNYGYILHGFIDEMDETGCAVCESYLRICDYLGEERQTEQIRNNMAVTMLELASFYEKKKDEETAVFYYCKNNALRERLLCEKKAEHHKKGLADGYYQLAPLLQDAEEQAELYQRALVLYRELAEQKGENVLSAKYRASMCCSELGRRELRQGQPESAKRLFQEAEALSESVAKETDKPGDRRRWAMCLVDAADVFMREQRYQKAEERLAVAKELLEQLLSSSSVSDDNSNLAIACVKLGECCGAMGKQDRAIFLVSQAAETLQGVMEHCGSVESMVNYTAALERMAQLYQMKGDSSAAWDCLEKVLPLRERCYEEEATLQNALNLAQACQNLFIARAFGGQAQSAADACDRAIDVLGAWAEEYPSLAEPPLSESWRARGLLCAKAEDEQMCLERAAELASKYPDHPVCKNVLAHLPKHMQPAKKEKKRGFLKNLFGKKNK